MSMIFLFSLFSPQPGLLLPGAAETDNHATVQVGSGVIVSTRDSVEYETEFGGFVRGTVSKDRFAFNYAFAETTWGWDIWSADIGVRYNVISKPKFHMAPFGAYLRNNGNGGYAGFGLAFEGGGSKVRWDLSVPLVGFENLRQKCCPESYKFQPLIFVYSEVGVSFAFSEHDLLRVGAFSVSPNVTYKHLFGESFFLGSTLSVIPGDNFMEIITISGGATF